MDLAKGVPAGQALRQARACLERGQVLPPGLIDPLVERSWRRSQGAGLAPWRAAQAPHLTAPLLRQAQDRRRDLVLRARPVMEYLQAQTRGSGSMVILADERGLLLETLGDADFLSRAERVALLPGASWHENHRGTNAIGTALAESAAVSVHGGEHFLDQNSFLTCTAAPVLAPDGDLVGVLDISGHHRSRHPHTAGLVSAAAHMIENRLFAVRHGAALRLHLHPQPDGIGTLAEGLLAVDGDGRICGANRAALVLLGLTHARLGERLEAVLDIAAGSLVDRARQGDGPLVVHTAGGQALVLRVEGGIPSAGVPVAGVPVAGVRGAPLRPAAPRPGLRAADALAGLDSGDPQMAQAIDRARKVAGKDIALLVMGESGTGKEVFARAVHDSSPRAKAAFVAVNCAALPEHLIEAELFGYAPGAFTGARRDGAPGRIRQAQGGTLFLDEIGDMPAGLQTRLLRVLQDRQVVPLGGGKPVAVDFALIAATHQPLKQAVADGRFRADLFYRLNGLTLTLPPLRARSDRLALAARVLAGLAPSGGPGGGITLSDPVAAAFDRYGWPGNLRQMANVLRTAVALLDPGDSCIHWHHLPDDVAEEMRCPDPDPARSPQDGDLRRLSRELMERTVAACGGNMSRAAQRLGISRNTLYRRLRGQAR